MRSGITSIGLPLFAALICALPNTANAQYTPPEITSARSFSGQFIVRTLGPLRGFAPASTAETNASLIRLEPTLLTVSCERIKQLLLHDLGGASARGGKIFLTLYAAETPDRPVTILSEKLTEGWRYRVELPELLDRFRYVRAIVQVLLVELANRNAESRSGEIPAWLIEGFTQQLLAANALEIILPPPRAGPAGLALVSTNFNARRSNPLEQAYKTFQSRPPLSFEGLSWPAENQWSGEAGEVYRCSAQLFLAGLLRLNDGRTCLQAMLKELPRHYNWQFAFLSAFHPYFQHTLDVEKWWSLQLMHFTGRDLLAQTWTFDESAQKLAQALRATVEIHTGTNALPVPADVSLQRVIREADRARQIETLQVKVRELDLLRPRLAPEFIVVVDNYRRVLQSYLQRPDKRGSIPLFGRKSGLDRATEESLNQLDELDVARALVQPAQKPLAARQP